MKRYIVLAIVAMAGAANAQTSVPTSEAGQAQALMQAAVGENCPVSVITGQAGAYTPLFGPDCTAQDKAAAQAALASFSPSTWRTTQYVDVTSASDPTLNGRYLADEATVLRFATVAAFAAANGRLPGGRGNLVWKDTRGNSHTFSRQQFVVFANAVSDFVYAMQNGDHPPNTVTIP